MTLHIDGRKVAYLIAKARELGGEEETPEASRWGGVARRRGRVVSRACAEARAELAGFIDGLAEDERCELIALAWIGRGVFTREEWESALVEARAHREPPTADYLLGNPLLVQHLESGLAELDETPEGHARARG